MTDGDPAAARARSTACRGTDLDLTGLRIRRAVRGLVLDPAERVMLVRFEFPALTIWATPGGGQEPGEDDEATLRRELDEELGLCVEEIGPHIWTRTAIIPFLDGSFDGQRDHVYLVRTSAFTPAPSRPPSVTRSAAPAGRR